AVGAVQRVARLRYLAAEALRQLAHGLLRVRVASRAAGVVQRDLAAGYRRALGQAELQQQVPDARTLAQARLAQGSLAGGAGGDDPGVSELFELRAQLGAGLLEELLTPGPVGDDAAAAEQDAHAAGKPRAQVLIGPVRRLGRYGPGLAAGEKDVGAFF